MSTIPLVEQLRARIRETVERVRKRLPLLAGETGILRTSEGQIAGGLIGGGKLIETVTKSVDEFLMRIKERRPNIVPYVLEKMRTYEPGKRIKEVLPTPTATPAPTPVEEKKKVLRG